MATYQEQIEKRRLEKEAKAKADAERHLSPDQVANWRLVLANMGVPFAMTMPEAMVQKFRDGIQARINKEFQHSGDGERQP